MTPTQRWKKSLLSVAVATLCVAACNRSVPADDEQNSLPLLVQTLGSVEDADVLNALLRGTLKGLEGRRDIVAPRGWTEVAARLAAHSDPKIRDLTDQLSQIFGDEAAVQRALDIVRDADATPAERGRQLTILLDQQNEEASGLLEGLLDVPELELTAIRGYAAVENKSAPGILLKRYPRAEEDLQQAIIETLSTRKSYAQALLSAVRSKVVSPEQVPTHVARSLHTLLGNQFVEVFGEPPSLGADREEQIAKWKKRLTAQVLTRANSSRGRVVFQKTCAACHQLYGEGGKIGPDLTGSNRANLDYLLLNSVDPSFDVPEAYRMTTIITSDGRVVNGVLAEEDGARVVLKTVEKPRLVIAKSDIEERVVSKKSMMPDGQLNALKAQQVFDLIKYLRTTEQVELPE